MAASTSKLIESSATDAARQPGPALEAYLRRDRVEGIGYGITDTWDKIVEAMMEIAPTTLEGVNQRVTEHASNARKETEEFQVQFEEAQDDWAFLRARVNALFRDRPFHRHTVVILDREVTCARRACASSEDKSAAIEAHVKTLEAQVATLIAQTLSLQNQLTTTQCDAVRSRNIDDNNDSGTGGRRQVSTICECTYTDFLKCQPMHFKGTKGVNSHVRAVEHNVAYALPWKTLKKMTTDKYCPKSKIKKLETRMWNLKVKGTDLMSYNQRFQEMVLMCDRMFLEKSEVVEKYVGGLPDMIHESVKASKPKTMHEAIEFTTELMDKKIFTIAECQANNKRKFEDTSRNNQNQQQPFKRNDVAWAYTAGPGEKKPYGGSKPLCPKCNYHHDGPCAPKNDCPKLKNGNPRNQTGNGNDVARACVVGTTGTNPNSNVVMEMGSFDVVISMDWLSKYHVVIVCDEKLVRVPFGNQILTFQRDRSNNKHESRLNIISYTKTQKYLLKGCPIFLAHVTTKEAKDKSKEKRLEDVPIV
uniref:Reverse transcriptase domain-containing protein n=1 Tax=Tanacetum cinerariifolium TaxID=118510 RepID=A0A699H348_TANCI|nr:reverse transcriptase domain-containing protein [Tanacetum cinerariifolium]GEW89423.1 reverse transcriptase domain-containing protein [Tanacetum cinerariifolium]